MVVESAVNDSFLMEMNAISGGINSQHFYTLQSEEVETTEQGQAGLSNSENVTFVDNDIGVTHAAPTPTSSVAQVDGTPDLTLGKYLSRPTLINNVTWTTAATSGQLVAFRPWFEYLNSPPIKKKIDNFGFIRGKLKLKILVNGTPFQYGCVRVCYQPMYGFTGVRIFETGISADAANINYSQLPGIFLHPQANAGGVLELPFFYHKNWLDLTSSSDVLAFGRIEYRIFAPLRVASSGGSTSVSVLCYAWMEDVELMASTNSLSLQSDEYDGDGQISGPASAIGRVASMLSAAPVIGPYARATAIGANAVAGIARIFGYCNPPVIEDVRGVVPLNGPMLASSQISTPVQKLTLDPKQELSLDPRLHGLDGTDELSIKYLTERESLFGVSTWSTSDNTGDAIFNMRVNPNQAQVTSFTGYNRVSHTPLSYLSHMFKNWRGDLIVRVKVVASKFHKGRLKLSFDPISDISLLDPPENTVYTQILDIGECDDVEIRIPYHQATAWLNNTAALENNWNIAGALTPRELNDNGLFTVRVNTRLVAPTSAPVSILFFMRAAENFEFANPTGHIGPEGVGRVPNFYRIQGEDLVNIEPEKMSFGEPTKTDANAYALNFGEKIVSLRDVLHRAVNFDSPIISASSGTPTLLVKSFKHMPYLPGYQPTAFPTNANQIIGTGTTASYAWTNMTHISYISALFVGYRGGVNYFVTPSFGTATSQLNAWFERVTYRDWITTTNRYIDQVVTTGTVSAREKAALQTSGNSGLGGAALHGTNVNNTLSVNIPDNKAFNFSIFNPADAMLGAVEDGTIDQGAVYYCPVTQSGVFQLRTHVSAGVDFTCLYFLCCPTVDYANAYPGVV